ncbi:Sugar tr domain containing protein [Trichuris trichiura]|uniref:Sugar tr domain containing protein n=1 Tax=Trichuris trichiura TaxID=36087 RepID=A0A077Z925_TRITR|nr:Sugar tr domain containing protein [Trichuris trichiura]
MPNTPGRKGSNFASLIYLIVIVLTGFPIGYHIAALSGAMLIVREKFQLSNQWQESANKISNLRISLQTVSFQLLVSSTVFAAAPATLFTGRLSDAFGRKKTMLLSWIFFAIGAIACSVANTKYVLLAGRILLGIGLGIACAAIPPYLTEMTRAHLRGIILNLFPLLMTLGEWLAGAFAAAFSYIENTDASWRLMLSAGSFLIIFQFFYYPFIPESPGWLASKNQMCNSCSTGAARCSDSEMNRRLSNMGQVAHQYQDERLRNVSRKGKPSAVLNCCVIKFERNGFIALLKSREGRKALILGCSLQLIQQLSGVACVLFYSGSIAKMSGVKDNTIAMWFGSLPALTNFIGTAIGTYLVEKVGRRSTVIWSTAASSAGVLFMGIGFSLIASTSMRAGYDESLYLNGTFKALAANDKCALLGCDACSYESICGFCYLPQSQDSAQSGACVSVYQKGGIINPNSALYGRCLLSELSNLNFTRKSGFLEPSAAFDYGYCTTSYFWIPIAASIVFLLVFALGLSGIPWTVNGEIYPNWARSMGNSASSFVNIFGCLVTTLTFLSLSTAITRQGVYYLYAALTAVSTGYLYMVLPETKGVGIDDIEVLLQGPWIYKAKRHCTFITAATVMMGFPIGYNSTIVSGAMLILREQFYLNSLWMQLITGIIIAAATIFGLLAGWLNELLGRKKLISASCILFIIGAVLTSISNGKQILVMGRFVQGMAAGIATTTVPAYTAELAPVHLRGALITLFPLCMSIGQLASGISAASLSYLENGNISWRLMFALGTLPVVAQLFLLPLIPESKEWLASKTQAKRTAAHYGKSSVAGEALGHAKIKTTQASKWQLPTSVSKNETRRSLLIGCSVLMFQQLTGVTCVMFYYGSIVKMSGVRDRSTTMWLASLPGIISLLGGAASTYLIEKCGRRNLILWSAGGSTVGLIIMGVGFSLIASTSLPSLYKEDSFVNGRFDNFAEKDFCKAFSCDDCSYQPDCGFCFMPTARNASSSGSCVSVYRSGGSELIDYAAYGRCSPKLKNVTTAGKKEIHYVNPKVVFDYGFCSTSYSWVPVAGSLVFLCAFSVGMIYPSTKKRFSGVPWAVNAELYPTWARSMGASAATFVNCVFCWVTASTFLSLSTAITRQGLFFLFASLSTTGSILMYLILPETKGISMEDIQALLKHSWIWNPRYSSFHFGHIDDCVIHIFFQKTDIVCITHYSERKTELC